MKQIFNFGKVRKAIFYKPKHYEAIPHYMTSKQKDPFDYKLRSKQEIIESQKKNPPDFPVEVKIKEFADLDNEYNHLKDKNRKVVLSLNMAEMKLSKLQKERLIQLIGPRYKNSDLFKIQSDQMATWEENYYKAFEILREVYWESLRAP